MFLIYRKILRESGWKGMWRGCWPNVGRAALVNLGDLSTYDSVKSSILEVTRFKDGPIVHCLSSGAAGCVSNSCLNGCVIPASS